jgi:molecular chaperone HscB
MDLFRLYDLPPTLAPDSAAVKKRYLELSRAHHPDRVAGASAEAQIQALQTTAAVNEGFRIFSNPDRTLAYALKSHGILEDEEKYTLPPAFLMEMMELNEAVDEGAEPTQAVEPYLDEWQAAFAPLSVRYEKGERDEALLLALKDAYFRKKYLLRIAGRLDTFDASR